MRTCRTVAALCVAVVIVAMGGCGDPIAKERTLCRQQAAVQCDRIYTCPALSDMRGNWTSKGACSAQRGALCDEDVLCPGTYHADNDQSCLDARNAVTCDQLDADPNALLPQVCLDVCTN